MSRRHLRRVGLPILALSLLAAAFAPTAALAHRPGRGLPHDVIVGTPGPDTLFGRARADLIFGLAGDDLLYGGNGPDRIFAGPGDDGVRGGNGPDTIRGGLGADRIAGGNGNDLILAAGDEAVDTIQCGDGRRDLAIVDQDDRVSNDCEFVWVRDPEV
jgi:Ca2+-binding RTX toxin-like protein